MWANYSARVKLGLSLRKSRPLGCARWTCGLPDVGKIRGGGGRYGGVFDWASAVYKCVRICVYYIHTWVARFVNLADGHVDGRGVRPRVGRVRAYELGHLLVHVGVQTAP